ncbi:MAG: hypothetical protein KJN68_01225 [Bacteroidia bacterium]|nr:hypothetical protein [Bacteroidia bacterium]NNK72238.1 hypothetical protein [Flavobacteriaceae bacterium]
MNGFKLRWGITSNWQLFYPIIGLIGLGYSSYKLAMLFGFNSDILVYLLTIVLFVILLKITLLLFKFLERRWKVDQRWKVIRIFIVFAVTGSLSLIVTRPIFDFVGFIKSNFDMNAWTIAGFYILKFFLILPFYTVLLVLFGWLFKEYKFFFNFALKMVGRFGLKKFTKQFESES